MPDYPVFFEIWFGQLVERVIRLHQYLSERSASAPESKAPAGNLNLDQVVAGPAVVEGVQSELEDLAQDLLRKATHLSTDTPLEHPAVYYAFGRTAASRFRRLHYVAAYIPTPWPSPEMELFLKKVLEEGGYSKDLSWTILLSGEYNFSHVLSPIADQEILDTRRVFPNLLSVPSAEKDNPLMWPNLLHEIAHQIGEDEGIVEAIWGKLPEITTSSKRAARLKVWSHEIVADLIAADFLGPAFFGALLNFAAYWIPDSLRKPTASHPAASDRVSYIREHLRHESPGFFDDVLDALLNDFNVRLTLDNEDIRIRSELYETLRAHGTAEGEFPTKEELLQFASMIRTLPEYLAARPKSFLKADENHIRTLAQQLGEGRLIASHRISNVVHNYRTVDKLQQGEDFNAALYLLAERPNPVRHILNAALVGRLSDGQGRNGRTVGFHQALLGDFVAAKDTPIRKRLVDFRSRVNRLDAVISKSMEAASVMAFYQDYRMRAANKETGATGLATFK